MLYMTEACADKFARQLYEAYEAGSMPAADVIDRLGKVVHNCGRYHREHFEQFKAQHP